VADMRLMGMFTSPKLIEPLQIERAIPALVFTSRASRKGARLRRRRYDPVTDARTGVTRNGVLRANDTAESEIVAERSPVTVLIRAQEPFGRRSDPGRASPSPLRSRPAASRR
jgi:hypothetical protein